MADNWATGVIHIFARPQTEILYLGEGKLAPETRHEKIRIGIQNDLTGGDYDRMHTGQRGITNWTVTRTNLVNLEIIDAIPGPAPGVDTLESMGCLLGTEGYLFPMWFLRARRNVVPMVNIGMRRGRRYPYSELLGYTPIEGTKENSFVMTFQHTQIYQSADGNFVLHDYNMNDVETIDITESIAPVNQ